MNAAHRVVRLHSSTALLRRSAQTTLRHRVLVQLLPHCRVPYFIMVALCGLVFDTVSCSYSIRLERRADGTCGRLCRHPIFATRVFFGGSP